MPIVTLLTRSAPTIGAVEFDAVLEDTFESNVTFTQYAIESGASAVDHGIIEPFQWSLIGAVSNNPLKVQATDFLGAISNAVDFPGASALFGLSIGLISGSDGTRSSEALDFLIKLQVSRIPFDINAGDIQLFNMVVSSLRRTKDPTNENGLVFEAQMQELPTLDTLLNRDFPKQPQLRDGDPAKSQAAGPIDAGLKQLREAGASINKSVEDFLTGAS